MRKLSSNTIIIDVGGTLGDPLHSQSPAGEQSDCLLVIYLFE